MQYLSNLLSVRQVWGGIATLVLFALCFVFVHLLKLSFIGYRSETKKTESPPPPKAEAEPVYYIVEKKKVRRKQDYRYSEPKRIDFPEKDPL